MNNEEKWSKRFLFLFFGGMNAALIGIEMYALIDSFLNKLSLAPIGVSVPFTVIGTFLFMGEIWMIKGLWHMMITPEQRRLY